ncbi:hypothetical protein [Flavobacterium sp. UMI-01]|uniref:hypothetical protein n=1 Tax=Flavobacterium sp. UMI-01 TaxID=1441053 RepID=UPI001C7CC060|nr:hypothetical protein [Flavobacterium sp. UMI-01]GIZ10466.1 hypothetical protein FUMI01_31900 [Flavobacterium sp. UMI-01]
MSKTTITLDKEYFTIETTKGFIKDLEIACKTMETDLFLKLFTKYDLMVEEYQEVLQLIIQIMNSWIKPQQDTSIVRIENFDSKCLFCNIGKKVKVYKWNYRHLGAEKPMDKVVYLKQIAFFFEYKNHQLVEFGVCNGYLDENDMNLLNA